jgi:hypothetical protein
MDKNSLEYFGACAKTGETPSKASSERKNLPDFIITLKIRK